ncbi:MAG TPA: RNA 2',3'-cyclic phosphodiesterase [Patescibacteria group bacterium]|nr:RNA 2',3'-cyclic phosphodiesterase [Patescibacteria group bacterium]
MTKRVFLATNLPDETKKQIAESLEKFKKKNNTYDIRWIYPENYHLTVHFFGDLNAKQINLVEASLTEAVKNIPSFEIKTGDIGYLPNKNNPRILFIKIIDIPQIHELVEKVELTLENLHFPIDKKPWKAHLSIARIKNYINCDKVCEGSLPSVSFEIKSVELMESHLSPDGSSYTILKSFPLKK